MRGGWPGGAPDESDEAGEEGGEEDVVRRFVWWEDGAVNTVNTVDTVDTVDTVVDAVDAVVEDVARRVVWFCSVVARLGGAIGGDAVVWF